MPKSRGAVYLCHRSALQGLVRQSDDPCAYVMAKCDRPIFVIPPLGININRKVYRPLKSPHIFKQIS